MIVDDDLVAVDEQLERLYDHVTDEKRAKRAAGRVPRHPVDDAKTNERRADVPREDLGRDGSGDAEAGEHRLRRDEEREPENQRGDAADREREAGTHGGRPPRPLPTSAPPGQRWNTETPHQPASVPRLRGRSGLPGGPPRSAAEE